MQKLILEVETNNNLKENDIIVYNIKKKCWEVINKNVFLNETNLKLKNIFKKISDLEEKINNTNENIGYISNVIKERI